MPDRSSERNGSRSSQSSSSENEPSQVDARQSSISKDLDSLDPEQDDLVGEKSLDDRFTDDQLERLVAMKDEYRLAGKKQRKELAHKMGEAFAAEIIGSGKDLSKSERGALMEWVKRWFAQRGRSRREPIRWSVHWSARMVLYKEQPERVIETQKRLYEAATGKVAEEEDMGLADIDDIEEVEDPVKEPSKPFHFFQRALTAEWDSLSHKEKQSYEEKARMWRSLGPDDAERRRMAEEHAPRTIRSLATNLYRQMGVRMFILATWEDTQGRVISGSDGRSYKIEHRSYLERIGLLDHYASFAQKTWPDKTSVVDRDVSPMDVTFDITGDSRPVLPDPTKGHPILKPYKHLPNLVRKFMDASYGLCRGIPVNTKSGHQVPWQQLQTRVVEFIDSEYLPDGSQASRTQQDGKVPFQFHHWEASPPIYEADGNTLKTPAIMVAAEPLPLVTADAPSEEEPPKPKPKRKRTRQKTKTPTALPTIASSTRKQSVSRSPSKARNRGDRNHKGKLMADDSGSLSDEEPALGEASERSTPATRGRSRERRQTPTDLVNATKKLHLENSPDPSDMEQEVEGSRVKGRKDTAEKERTRKGKKGSKASDSQNDADGNEVGAVEKPKPTKSRANKRTAKADKPVGQKRTKRSDSKGHRGKRSGDVSDGSDGEQGDGEGSQGHKTPRRATSGKNVQWSDLETLASPGDGDQGNVDGSRSHSPRKQTAEERDLLAIANSSRYKVNNGYNTDDSAHSTHQFGAEIQGYQGQVYHRAPTAKTLEHALVETRKLLQIKEEEARFLRGVNAEMVEAFTLIRKSLVAYAITEAGDPGYAARIEATNRLGRQATSILKEYIEKDGQYYDQVKAQVASIISDWKARTGCNLMECDSEERGDPISSTVNTVQMCYFRCYFRRGLANLDVESKVYIFPTPTSTCSDCKSGCGHIAAIAALEKEVRQVQRQLSQAHARELEYQTQNEQFFSALLHVNRISSIQQEEAKRIRESVQELLNVFLEYHEGTQEFVLENAGKKFWIVDRLKTWEWQVKDWVRMDNQKEEAYNIRLEQATQEYRGEFMGWDPRPPHTETEEETSEEEAEMAQEISTLAQLLLALAFLVMSVTADSLPHTEASTQPTSPLNPNISTLAGPQPWVIREAKARLVDLIVCYEELLEKFGPNESSPLLGHFMRQIDSINSDFQRQVDNLTGQTTVATGDSEGTNITETDSDEENITFPAVEGRAFLEKYGDPEDIEDVDCGPDNQRRQHLYFGPGSPFYEAQERERMAGADNTFP
ncbi:hypothetical protein NMY22_g6211 [Coprinellus aureogranulatus]|nr:hypothetical protein NMY22_g6211 [Coprinellus aureogranulatus]